MFGTIYGRIHEAIRRFLARAVGGDPDDPHMESMFQIRNIWGILRWDQRSRGEVREGQKAVDLELTTPDGTKKESLLKQAGAKPLVLIFGSFT